MSERKKGTFYDLSKARSIILYKDNSKESDLAEEYLSAHEISELPVFEERKINNSKFKKILEDWQKHSWGDSFFNSFKEPWLPTLLYEHGNYMGYFKYYTFSGVKAFIREMKEEQLRNRFIDEKRDDETYWRGRLINYSYDHYPDVEGSVHCVACFDGFRDCFYKGPIEHAPHPVSRVLRKQPYDLWSYVDSWEIGAKDEIVSIPSEQYIKFIPSTNAFLFDDDIEKLGKRKIIPVKDDRSIYHVRFEGYVQEKGVIYGVYGEMYD